MLNIKQPLETVKYWLGEISKHNDKTIKVTENLRIALINLKIEEAHLSGTQNGIRPIADLIERSINELHDSTKNIVTNGRKALRSSFSEVEIYIENNDDN
jgi:N-methylhydantoinase B/oxoprolinase/acetone carboxylase alpha subunit